MADGSADMLHNLKRRRTRERANATRFTTTLEGFDDSTPLDDLEYYRGRLQETLDRLISLDDAIHDLLPDKEYDEDTDTCEEYIDKTKRAIQRASRYIDNSLSASTARLSLDRQTQQTIPAPTGRITHSVKLPAIKLDTFKGDVETWSRFWEQFRSSIDEDASLSTINKHVFLRGYLEGEPKMLVEGIAVTANTYEETKRILLAKYGDSNRIIQAHLDFLENLPPATSAAPDELNFTFIECHRRIQALRALGEDVNSYGRVLAPKILRAFPPDICQRWIVHVKRQDLSEGDILKLLEFLGEEVDGALVTQKIRGESNGNTSYIPSAAALHVSSKQSKLGRKERNKDEPFCVFCEAKGHWAQDCKRVTSVTERREKLKTTHRCFLCLNRGHNAGACNKRGKVMCTKCRGAHHRSICIDADTNAKPPKTPPTTVGKIDVVSSNFTYLQTARVEVIGPSGASKITRCVLDGGSQSSFVSKSLIDALKLDVIGRRDLAVSAFESSPVTSSPRRLVSMELRSIWTAFSTTITAYESAYEFIPQPTVPPNLATMTPTSKLQLADPRENGDLPIEILIGSDYYWTIVKDSPLLRMSPSTVLLPSNFGWILSGKRTGISTNVIAVHFLHSESLGSLPDAEVKRFWELETIGITAHQDRGWGSKDSSILKAFHDSFRTEANRRVVSLPRKKDVAIPTNRQNAMTRFRSLETRLRKNTDLRTVYYAHMLDYIKQGQVEEVEPEEEREGTFYLPHQVISKGKRRETKWRIVFDASSHEKDAPSLNDALEMGPNLLPELLAILLRFRLSPRAIVGDIRQAFLQLQLEEKDRDLTRFFWYRVMRGNEGHYKTTDEVVCYRFTRLPFGLTCSPFLLSAAVRELATKHADDFPLVAPLVDRNTFMDDFAAGAEDDNGVITIYYQLTALMRQFSFPMGKWASNSEPLRDIWKSSCTETKDMAQVLGLNWDTRRDTLFIDHRDVLEKAQEGPLTKRRLLQAISRFYDPVGLMSPVLITGKLIFQESWCRGVGWDEILPDDLGRRWRTWATFLPHLLDIHIPRWVGSKGKESCSIHVFCDASEKAYGAVLYIRSTHKKETLVRIVCSKNRLAPLKRVTLPRLELIAALVGARLLDYFCRETGHDATRATLWSDSTVALGWICSDPKRWKPFVANRVIEIQSYTTPSQWMHCPGEDNPADHLSRGVSAENLQELQNWWHGPSWLSHDPYHSPTQKTRPPTTLPEERLQSLLIRPTDTRQRLLDASSFSSYWRLLRVTAWVFRFVRYIRGRRGHSKELNALELKEARLYWIREVQREYFGPELQALQEGVPLPAGSLVARFNPFLEDGFIRIGGRLQYADLLRTQIHPVLLHGSHHFTALLIRQTHIRLHHLGVRIVLSELRDEFWILRARQAIKRVLHTCLPCKIAKNPFGREQEAPLPADRVTAAKPFQVTGIDFAGPLYVHGKPLPRKCYIVLFTCATVRAVHLELCSNMTADAFLLALQRFVGRRGVPHTIYTDNAQTFQAANKELVHLWETISDVKTHRLFAQNGITWKFIAPRAAWWGGWWERMIGTTKRCLRKVLGKTLATDEELSTTLINVEAVLNSRPITQDAEDALTPAHFLCGAKLTALPSTMMPNSNENLKKTHQRTTKMANDFWRRWEKEYLLELKSFHVLSKPKGKSVKVRVGDVVLLHEDCRPRHMWKKARVEELKVGRDGASRTVVLRGANGTLLVRPIQLVIPLEVDQGGEDVENS